ncbi:AAA family ATPase [Dysgonomonas sp. 25]|uniref:AAA family ATPase n=1 Tax=Dysgonomonas sp. 25 TaxID=2302933 RepID=UPI0013D6B650|nr:AAA family ATPase [Dysgonomonas sp. 25]NDV68768.1 ATP-binding protein [Dysgonomonas sp. 25]
MKVSFENLGVVKRIDLDLSKKLSVFCGPNGTGKTYVCYAVYEYIRPIIVNSGVFDLDLLIKEKKLVISLDYDMLFELKKEYNKRLPLDYAFGVKKESFFSDFNISLNVDKEEFISKLRYSKFIFSLANENMKISYEKDAGSDELNIILENFESLDSSDSLETADVFQNSLLVKCLSFSSLLKVFILPVERNSAYTFANELAKNRLSSDVYSNRYPRAIQDTLATAIDLNHIKKQTSEYYWLAEEIENTILHGDVKVSENGELQFAPRRGRNTVLSIHLSASIIKNLSGLLIYLKHQARKNDLLIIDEPELGLHPDNQILLARIFAKLINNGIRLLISTHSDYIIRELNNLIMLSGNTPEIEKHREEWGYKEDECIKPEDVGAYLFNFTEENPSHVVVENLSVDETGFEVKTIDEAICNLNSLSEDIYYALKYGEDKMQ